MTPSAPDLRQAFGLYQSGAWLEARRLLSVLVAQTPADPTVLGLLGAVAARLGESGAVLPWFRRAARLDPVRPEALRNLATALLAAGQPEAAWTALAATAALAPGDAGVWAALTGLAQQTDRTAVLERALARHVRLAPGDHARHLQLAHLHTECRHLDLAMEQYRIAERIDPSPAVAARRILLMSLTDAAPDAILTAAREWSGRYAEPLARPLPRRPDDPERRLRVGYLCPLAWTLGRIFMPILRAHDPRAVEAAVYVDGRGARNLTDAPAYWDTGALYREVGGLDDAALAERIRSDGIDILVDGVGFPDAPSRLLTLARRAAPVQLHFPAMTTTGMTAVDCLLVDPVLVPEGGEAAFQERIWRLPFGYHHAPLVDPVPAVGPLPLLRNGHVTFGSFNQVIKLGPAVPRAWARILTRCSGSRLVIKAFDLTPALANELCAEFAGLGVAPERVVLVPPTATHAEHLAWYREIDIHLDSFPYNGVTTTAEALWMGVPVIALAGRRILDRYSASMLRLIGLEACVADSPDGYVEAACRLAADPLRLAELRAELRGRAERSRLMDTVTFTRDLEDAYRQIWRRACSEGAPDRV